MEHEIPSLISEILDVHLSTLDFHRSFVSQGGDSLRAISLSALCRNNNINLPVSAILHDLPIKDLVDHIKLLSPCEQGGYPLAQRPAESLLRPQVLKYLSRCPVSQTNLTDIQHAFVQSTLIQGHNNFVSFRCTYEARSIPYLKEGWRKVIESEQIFRLSGGTLTTGEGLKFHDAAQFLWEEVNVDNEDDLHQAIYQCPRESLVTNGFKAITLHAKQQTTVVWNVHHALIDGWSATCAYQKACAAAEGDLIHAGTPFTVVSEAINRYHAEHETVFKRFWELKQQSFPEALGNLGLQNVINPAKQRQDQARYPSKVTIDLDKKMLKDFMSKQSVTLASIVCSAWSIVHSQYTDTDTIKFGVVVSGRSIPIEGASDTIGPLLNTLPLFMAVDRTLTSTSFIKKCFGQLIELDALQCSIPSDGSSRDFASAVTQDPIIECGHSSKIWPVSGSDFDIASDFPLSLNFDDDGRLQILYKIDEYRSSDMTEIARRVQQVLLTLLSPYSTVNDCVASWMSPQKCRNILDFGNAGPLSTCPRVVHDDLITLFERAAQSYPNLVALQCGAKQLTYQQLDLKSNTIDQRLRQVSVSVGDFVGVRADRSINWIIAVYAVLKAGAVYVPLDTAYNPTIMARNLELLGCDVVICPNRATSGSGWAIVQYSTVPPIYCT